MRNCVISDIDISRSYDLKGSLYHRSAFIGKRNPNAPLKDLDFLSGNEILNLPTKIKDYFSR